MNPEDINIREVMNPADTNILFLTCSPRAAQPLMEELTDKLVELDVRACVVAYGIMQKGLNGFIILAVEGRPAQLIEKIRQDQDVSGYVLVPNEPRSTEVQV